MNDKDRKLLNQAVCPECGEMRVPTGYLYSACPNGHGKLHRRCTTLYQFTRVPKLLVPEATRVKAATYKVDGRPGLYHYRDGNGIVPRQPGEPVGCSEVIARIHSGCGLRIRKLSKV